LSTDPVKLKITLRNLVTNALKNTEQGSVAVSVHSSGDGVEFRVNDTGTGIPPEALEVIFEPFRQLGTRGANRGVGLGLYITRRLADMLGGTISVDSTVGRGSTFRVWVPCRAAGATGGSGL
jgi:signal transduction histidine kinase